jgi:hypothetical protein
MPVAAALVRRPDLWMTALRQARRMAPTRWWVRPPFLPLPARDYLGFRTTTMYGGDGSATPEPADVVVWLEWCRRWPQIAA